MTTGSRRPDGTGLADAGRPADGTRLADYDYRLPPERIAQYPADERDSARLLILEEGGGRTHGRVRELVDRMEPGDVVVVNESAVFPARLLGRKPTGAEAEVLLVRPWGGGRPEGQAGEAAPSGDAAPSSARPRDPLEGLRHARLWEALVRPGGKLKPGRTVVVSPELSVEIVDSLESGNRVVRLVTDLPVEEALERYGHVPLPPYIDRDDEALDRSRYQTVYARTPGSVAAPTAGLHLTDALLALLADKGVRRAAVTLHVGVGTFRPVEAEDPAEHEMHAEWYSVPEETADVVNEARARGGRIWAVGTTAVRTLESAVDDEGRLSARSGDTRLFIRPPYDFRVVDGLLTNFHLPRSTLLMLVAALAGYQSTMDAYRSAVEEGYRFYSYGDAMLVTPEARAGHR